MNISIKLSKKINKFKYKLYFENKTARLGYPPLELFIEPTSICNLRCPMCPQSTGLTREGGFMDMELYKKIIRQARELKIYKLSLFMGGESLLHKELPEMIRIADNLGINTRLHTNATALTGNISKELIRAGLKTISFSFDGETRERFEKIRVGADYDKVLSNIKGFLECKRESTGEDPYTIVQVIKDYDPKNPSAEISEKFKNNFSGLPVNLFKPILLQSFAGHLKDTDFDHIPYSSVYTPCVQIWRRFVIGWDGRAIACCVDLNGENIVGDANKQSLMEIWNSDAFIQLRQQLIDEKYKDIRACRECDFLWRDIKDKKKVSPIKRVLKNIIWRLIR
jgi:radical SAM protein with 4Fe4S-binding SPASM domain